MVRSKFLRGAKSAKLFGRRKAPKDALTLAACSRGFSAQEALLPQTSHAWDGCDAVSDIAYDLSETAFIYPITPSSPMGELMDGFNAAGRKNLINGTETCVKVMQSEGGAAGAVHGAISAGSLSVTFTSSQGLLLMIPNLYEVAAEGTPGVFHIAARAITKHALSIYGDHSDVMGVRQTGIPLLCSNTPQEAHDLALVTHIATLKASIPLIHFFDGQRTSAVIQKVRKIPAEIRTELFPWEDLQKNLRDTSINPARPFQQGSAQGPDIYFQSMMANKPVFDAVPGIIEQTMEEVGAKIGRKYGLFEYFGDPEATKIAVCMGSANETFEEAINEMRSRGEKVGLVKVRLYRPWRADKFLDVIPKTVEKVVVMDRTYEDGANAQPLQLDVQVSFADVASETGGRMPMIIGGVYGLSAKEFTPAMVRSCFANLDAGEKMKKRFTIGINDDVSNTSLKYGAEVGDFIDTVPKGTIQCQFWGLGGDGTVGANKEAIKTIADETDLYVQGHFAYTAHKSGGVTISHLRFGPQKLQCEYEVETADFVGVHHRGWLQKFPIVEKIKDGGVLVLNSPWSSIEELEANIPGDALRLIKDKNIRFYNIDANSVAKAVGLGGRINNIMQSVFYKLSGVLEEDYALELLRKAMHKMYGSKGEKVVQMNIACIDKSQANLWQVEVPDHWGSAQGVLDGDMHKEPPRERDPFINDILLPVADMRGNSIPVSAFPRGGLTPSGTTEYEKRGIAPAIPVWIPDKCTQCNYCALVCPHGVIRPFLLDKQEAQNAPDNFEMRKSKGGGDLANFQFSIQVAAYDCTGCEVCTKCCPDDALYMAPFEEVKSAAMKTWEYARTVAPKDLEDKTSVKGSQFLTPGLEFSGACAGCGETPYVKLATQLFGQSIVIANATGCSSIWGGSAPANPYKIPWANSLFEDAAEFGYGMGVGASQRRLGLAARVEKELEKGDADAPVKDAMKTWLKQFDKLDMDSGNKLEAALKTQKEAGTTTRELDYILAEKDMYTRQSQWIVGGDGWAYDIGWGGLDHVISSGQNINVLILDTEMYSNTGGQASKSTPIAASVKFASGGNTRGKKDLGLCAMSYGNVYVASVAMGADYNQTVRAFREAEEYPGPSVIQAFSPCIDWGIQMANMMDVQNQAVETGYWPLYRYDPRLESQGANPFQLDSKKLRGDVREYLKTNNRYAKLIRSDPETANDLQDKLKTFLDKKYQARVRQDLDDVDLLRYLKSKLGEDAGDMDRTLILYGSETGQALELAGNLSQELKRRDVQTKVLAMDDYEWADLSNESNVIVLCSTCGQGEFPPNCRDMWKWLNEEHPTDLLSNTPISVFGLGDTHYVYFNEAAKQFDRRFRELGAPLKLGMGLGDDQDEDRWETAWEEWFPDYCNKSELKQPEKTLLPASYNVTVEGTVTESVFSSAPKDFIQIPLKENQVMCDESYDRDFRHYVFDVSEVENSDFDVGDTINVFPRNSEDNVKEFLGWYGLDPNARVMCENLDLDRKDPLPDSLSALELFQGVLDLYGKPKRRFYEMLSMTATDEGEKEVLESLMTEDGEELRKEFAGEFVTYADVLKRFPSAKPELAYLIDYIAPLKPRLYSIANSPKMHPGELHMFVVNNDWLTASGQYRHGITTEYMKDCPAGSLVAGRLGAAAVTIPEDHTLPMVCAGMGSGLAPIRGYIQDRAYAAQQGESTGPTMLFFGSRDSDNEWFYQEEMTGYQKDMPNFDIHPAFSRDQAQKIYLQDKMAQHGDKLYQYLVEEGGYFYYCGAGGNAPDSCRKAVRDAIVKNEGIPEEEAEQIICDMQINGKYNVEAW